MGIHWGLGVKFYWLVDKTPCDKTRVTILGEKNSATPKLHYNCVSKENQFGANKG